MKKNPTLYKHLLSLQKEEVFFLELKEYYTPINLSSQLENLMDLELISVDWERKVILIQALTTTQTLRKKDELGSYTREVPEYMKDEKIELNKPYIPKQKKE